MKKSSVLTSFRRKSLFAVIAMAMALLFPVLTSPVAFAFGSGNGSPYSNGTHFSTEGTFQNTIRGVNLSGVASFSTGDVAAASVSSGTFTVSYQGTSYTGNVDGSIDPAAGTVAAAMEASVTRQGSGTSVSTISSSFVPTGTATVDNPETFVIEPSTGDVIIIGGGQTTVDTYGWVDVLGTSNYQDTSYVSGSFTAKLQNSWPNQIFKGSGKMAFTSINFDLNPPVLATTYVNISVKGVRISDTSQTFTLQTVQAPSIITTTESVNR